VPAILVDAEGRLSARVALDGGGSADLRLGFTPSRRPAQDPVSLGVRPEHLFRFDAKLKARKPSLAPLTAPVELVEPTGAETMAQLKPGERDIVDRFDPDGATRMGEILPLGVDMSHACLFDPADETLIPRDAT
jgi:multiple sugar transport system ATP-binding protein